MRKFFESVNPRLGRALRSRLQKILTNHSATIANISIGISPAFSALKNFDSMSGEQGCTSDYVYFRQASRGGCNTESAERQFLQQFFFLGI